MLCAFFWVIPRRLEFICRRFATLCFFSFLVHSTHIYLPMKMGQTECSETSAYKRRLEFICRRFETLCFFLIPSSFYSHLPAYEDGTECSETSAYKLQTPGYYPKESIQHKYWIALRIWSGRFELTFSVAGAWMSVSCQCRVLSRRGLCVELITRPEESYRLWCVVVCGL